MLGMAGAEQERTLGVIRPHRGGGYRRGRSWASFTLSLRPSIS